MPRYRSTRPSRASASKKRGIKSKRRIVKTKRPKPPKRRKTFGDRLKEGLKKGAIAAAPYVAAAVIRRGVDALTKPKKS